jgi:hypothetical protein
MLTRTVSSPGCQPRRSVGLLLCCITVVSVVTLVPGFCNAQDLSRGVSAYGMWQPLHHNAPPGQVAAWLNAINNHNATWLQPVRVELPSEGSVAVFSASQQPTAVLSTPAQFSAAVGHVYRLRLAGMPEFPGVEIFPTVEILDRLHPPAGREQDYPIPVVITEDDLRIALSGRLVTRIVYLEQPQLAVPYDPLRRDFPQSTGPRDNAMVEADRKGRPMMIVRIGGRTPSPFQTPASFYGTGGAVDASSNANGDPPVPRQAATGRSHETSNQPPVAMKQLRDPDSLLAKLDDLSR